MASDHCSKLSERSDGADKTEVEDETESWREGGKEADEAENGDEVEDNEAVEVAVEGEEEVLRRGSFNPGFKFVLWNVGNPGREAVEPAAVAGDVAEIDAADGRVRSGTKAVCTLV